MDLEYLLWLQDLRKKAGGAIENIFTLLSDSVVLLIVASIFIYILIDKKKGLFILFTYSICSTLNSFIKLTACVYRPWIREPKIIPAGKSMKYATGYSFPSGHTSIASSCSLGILNQFSMKKILAALFFIYVLLVAFSRNFLGCHTPQDVLVAIAESILALFAARALIKFIQQKEGNAKIVFICSTILYALLFAYILLKPYPLDKDAAGNLLADPVKMQNDGAFDFAFALGIMQSWYLESRFVKFSTDNMNAKKRALRFTLILVFVLIVNCAIYPAAKLYFDKRLAKFICGYLRASVGMFLGPLVFTKIEKALKW